MAIKITHKELSQIEDEMHRLSAVALYDCKNLSTNMNPFRLMKIARKVVSLVSQVRGELEKNMAVEVNGDDFASEVLESDIPVLVDFWAPWCGPCRQTAPAFENASNEFNGKVLLVKVNVDESPDIASKYNIKGIPAFLGFKDGKVVSTDTGRQDEISLRAICNNLMGK